MPVKYSVFLLLVAAYACSGSSGDGDNTADSAPGSTLDGGLDSGGSLHDAASGLDGAEMEASAGEDAAIADEGSLDASMLDASLMDASMNDAAPDADSPDASPYEDGGDGGDAGLWSPDPAELPASGNYIFIDSEPGDFIGVGLSYLYTQANAVIELRTTSPGEVEFHVDGFENWRGGFEPVAGMSTVVAGYWPEAFGYPFYQPGVGWSGEGRGCSGVAGWLLIEHVKYEGDALTEIDLRFEQRCNTDDPALRGAIHWRADDPTAPPGPVYPVPAHLWRAAPGIAPGTGNYALTEWDGDITIYQSPTNTIGVGVYNPSPVGSAFINITGGPFPTPIGSDFEAMVGYPQLVPGYYPDARLHPFHNPARGGFNWMVEGSSCDFTGWFAIDHIVYSGTRIDELELRFERLCDGNSIPRHGQIHFVRP